VTVLVKNGSCLEVMQTMTESTACSIVTDPPYGLSFMGKEWDHGIPGKAFWIEALRVAKPGAHLLAFGGTRTYHRLACAIEDAGWEIRDCVMWVYGSGFPKSLDVSKAIDKAAGAEREVVGNYGRSFRPHSENTEPGWDRPSHDIHGNITAPATDAAKQWAGWGTALKPAWEPIIVARKPLLGTVAENVIQHGTGAINVDGCRVAHNEPIKPMKAQSGGDKVYGQSGRHEDTTELKSNGRWPANLMHDGSDEVLGLFPVTTSGVFKQRKSGSQFLAHARNADVGGCQGGDTGSAARFFYCAKASKADRDEGCEGLEDRGSIEFSQGKAGRCPEHGKSNKSGENTYACGCKIVYTGEKARIYRRNHHPTVKPTALMRYLCRLVTPPGGIVLDPFMGSGSTGKAAVMEGLDFIGIEQSKEYCEIAEARIASANKDGEALLFK